MAVSYWPFLDLFRAGFGFTIGEDEAARASKIVAALSALVVEGALDEVRQRELVPTPGHDRATQTRRPTYGD